MKNERAEKRPPPSYVVTDGQDVNVEKIAKRKTNRPVRVTFII